MTRIYVDLGIALRDGNLIPDEESVRPLEFLADAGHEILLVGEAPPDELTAVAHGLVASAPLQPDRRSWYLTDDVERCQGATARLRTVLIGAAPPAGSIHRCDAVARDLQAAAMEILAAEAMPAPSQRPT